MICFVDLFDSGIFHIGSASILCAESLNEINETGNVIVLGWLDNLIHGHINETMHETLIKAYNFSHRGDENWNDLDLNSNLTNLQIAEVVETHKVWELSEETESFAKFCQKRMVDLIGMATELTYPNWDDMIASEGLLFWKAIELINLRIGEEAAEEEAQCKQNQQNEMDNLLQQEEKSNTSDPAHQTQIKSIERKYILKLGDIERKYTFRNGTSGISSLSESIEFITDLKNFIDNEQIFNMIRLFYTTNWVNCETRNPALQTHCQSKANAEGYIRHNQEFVAEFETAWTKKECKELKKGEHQSRHWNFNDVKFFVCLFDL